MTDDELRDYIRRGRIAAARVGSMHGQWDTITDAEIILGITSGRALLSREEVELTLRNWLDGPNP
jgi:hypothetical protein